MSGSIAAKLTAATRTLCREVAPLRFGRPVTHVYNPLEYARRPHDAYVACYGSTRKRVLLLGMNPGPFGMVQTGVPFGNVADVRDCCGSRRPCRGLRGSTRSGRCWASTAGAVR